MRRAQSHTTSFALLLAVALLSVSYSSCGGDAAASAEPEAEALPRPPVGASQIVLLTQDRPYDEATKTELSAPYVRRDTLIVPADLSPQGKWVMFEGPVLENDQVAYRFYMDSRHRFDIYGKRVPDLVMDTVGWDYHDVMDWGSDVLKVGNSLGIGSPAILYQDSLYTLSACERKELRVPERGESRPTKEVAELITICHDLPIGTERVTISQYWNIKSGSHASQIMLKVTEGQLPEGAQFATGVVKHLDEYKWLTSDASAALYTYGDQSFHGDGLGMAVVGPAAMVEGYADHPLSHLMLFKPGRDNASYYMVSGWELGVVPVASATAFERVLTEEVMPSYGR